MENQSTPINSVMKDKRGIQMNKIDLFNHQLWIHVPSVEQPENGFPVLYVLDGNAYTKLICETMELQINNSKRTGVSPMIIVGIGYQGDGRLFKQQRTRDFTTPSLKNNGHPRGANLSEFAGGILDFQLELDGIKSYIEEHFPVDKMHQGIFGHSLGGLFVCESLYIDKPQFSHYMAISPSLWWNEHELLKREKTFQNKNLLICVEGETSMKDPALEYFAACKEEGAASEVSQILTYDKENHMSVVMTSISEVLRFFNTK